MPWTTYRKNNSEGRLRKNIFNQKDDLNFNIVDIPCIPTASAYWLSDEMMFQY
jgi:hypothetical protein